MLTSAPESAVRTHHVGVARSVRSTSRPSLHCSPPATPWSFYEHRRSTLLAIGVAFALLATGAAIHDGWLLLRWDLPIQRFVEAHRTADLTFLFRAVSRLGSTLVVFALSASLAVLTWRRCRAVSIAIAVAAIARPLLEFVLKGLVAHDRPISNASSTVKGSRSRAGT